VTLTRSQGTKRTPRTDSGACWRTPGPSGCSSSTRPTILRCWRLAAGYTPGGHQPSRRLHRAGRGADAHRDRRGRGVPGHLHRTHRGGHRRTARAADDRVPEPPRRLPRRRVRIPRPAQGVPAEAARQAGINQLLDISHFAHRDSLDRRSRPRKAPGGSGCYSRFGKPDSAQTASGS